MVFTYYSRELRDPKSGWWVVEYTQFAVKATAFLLIEVYDSYQLWCLSAERIRNISCLDLVQVSGSCANAEELELLLCVIEHTNFESLPDDWSRRGEGRSLAPGWCHCDSNYLFYNQQNEREFSYNEDWRLVRTPRARLPAGHRVGWDLKRTGCLGVS